MVAVATAAPEVCIVRQSSELFRALWRVLLGLLVWNAASLALFGVAAVCERMTGRVGGWWEAWVLGLMLDLIELSDRLGLAFLFTLLTSLLGGVVVLLLTLVLRLAGAVSLAQPDVRRALWLAAADVALPVATVYLYLLYNPPSLIL